MIGTNCIIGTNCLTIWQTYERTYIVGDIVGVCTLIRHEIVSGDLETFFTPKICGNTEDTTIEPNLTEILLSVTIWVKIKKK